MADSLYNLLPAPVKSYEVFSDADPRASPAAAPAKPPPARLAGGGVGSSAAVVPVTVDAATGAARFDAIVTAQHRGKHVQTQFSELVERRAADVVRMRPSAEEEAAVAARTRAALDGIVGHALANARPTQVDANTASRAEEAKFIRYTPSADTPGFTAATAQRIIRMVEAPVDPLEPPKFKHKKVPAGPPEAPVPVLRSPPRKVTAEDQEAWRIPPSVSNWKNPHGYVVPLDKRLAADGRSLLEPVINDNFARLSEALLIAERKARVEVETRAAIQKKLALKESEAKEAELRALAARARMERSGIANLAAAAAPPVDFEGGVARPATAAAAAQPRVAAGPPLGSGAGPAAFPAAARRAGGGLLGGDYDDADAPLPPGAAGGEADEAEDHEAARERERLRGERKRERERELRAEAGGGKKSRLARDEERDVSERIALGMPVGTGAAGAGGAEALYDTRLFNQAEGMQAGFGGEDEYAVYSAPWRADGAAAGAAASYRPRGGLGSATEGAYAGSGGGADEQLRKLQDASKFGAPGGGARDFEGVAVGGGRTAGAPVQFERAVAGTAGASASAADPFGLDAFLGAASSSGSKGGGALDKIGSRGFMAAAGGGVARSAEEYAGGSGRDRLQFQASSGR